MNTNLEVDNEEDQRIQYVNRPAISIPSGGAIAFNLNIVNPGISNQSYILNSVSPVSQNIVAYQSPVTLQSYIALPGDNGDNIVNNLPVGVVPMGLPVSAELLQNPGLVNTSIIIGNEECNPPVIFKQANNDVPDHGDYKISYIQKPVMGDFNNGGAVDSQNIRLSNASTASSDGMSKKPCPLEMSIKAANIDLEFDEKCESEVTLAIADRVVEPANIPIIPIIKQNAPIAQVNQLRNIIMPDNLLDGNILKAQQSAIVSGQDIVKPRTEITWDSKDIKVNTNNIEFQESLICEVEEANDDEDDLDEESGENDDNDNDEDYTKGSSAKKESSSSSEESDVPLSEVIKLDKIPDINKNEKTIKDEKIDFEVEKKAAKRGRPPRARKQVDRTDFSLNWNDSDEDVLDLKRIKNEFNYNCYYEPKTMKSVGGQSTKPESDPKKFIKVRNCCSKKECYKKITLKDQKAAHKNFYDLESKSKQNVYLINCLEHVQMDRTVSCEDAKENNPVTGGESSVSHSEGEKVENTNIQLDIENESNGNQMLSDEIQKAINESLKDCLENQQKEEEEKNKDVVDEDEVKVELPSTKVENIEVKENHWNYYIVIDRCRKKVCLQFLIKLFRISKTRIKLLQKKILSGTPLTDDISSPKPNEKNSKIWETAKLHLGTVKHEECEDCHANPRHNYFINDITRQELFDEFKEYYLENLGTELNLKYSSYKKFLVRETNFSFLPRKSGVCSECELLQEQQRKEQRKLEKAAALQNKIKKLDRCVQYKKRGRKKKEYTTDSEEYSMDDEPLSKQKKIKLKISLKTPKIKNSNKKEKKIPKKDGVERVERRGRKKLNKEEKPKPIVTKGRDVWSLMLLHLETMPYKVCKNCISRKKHKFFDSSMTTQALYEDYRKYFLKETNSELGLGFTMYEKYFERNCGYTIKDIDVDSPECPRCALEPPKPSSKTKKSLKVNNLKTNKKSENLGSNCRS